MPLRTRRLTFLLVSFDSIDMESSLAAAPVDGAKVGELTVKGCEVLAKDIITVDVAMENDDDNKNDDDDDDPENNDENKKEDEADDRACEDFVGSSQATTLEFGQADEAERALQDIEDDEDDSDYIESPCFFFRHRELNLEESDEEDEEEEPERNFSERGDPDATQSYDEEPVL